MAESIVFPDTPPARWVFERVCVAFPAQWEERKFSCLASAELLHERFGARDFTEVEAMRAYEKNRLPLQQIARARILAGNIVGENEVVLTRESFAFKEVDFAAEVKQQPYHFQLVRQVTSELEEVLGNSAGLASVEWSWDEDAKGRPQYVLTVRDFCAQAKV